MKKLAILTASAVVLAAAITILTQTPATTLKVETVSADSLPKTKTSYKADVPGQSRNGDAPTIPNLQSNQAQASKATQQAPTAAEDFPPPESLANESIALVSEITLWQLSTNRSSERESSETNSSTSVDDLAAETIRIDPAILKSLHLGQIVRLPLPDGAGDIEAELRDTYNDPAGVQVWMGSVKGDLQQAGIVITRGNTQTHFVIATTQGNYSAVIDNQSGDGTLLNESAIHAKQQPYDDGIVYPPGETEASPHYH